jgi:hypothetical protein
METLNKYLGMLPTIKYSPMDVASTELGNLPFKETTHGSIIFSHLPVAWRNQYNLMHKTIPESPRAMLLDLENIEKMHLQISAQISASEQISGHEQIFVQISRHAVKTSHIGININHR